MKALEKEMNAVDTEEEDKKKAQEAQEKEAKEKAAKEKAEREAKDKADKKAKKEAEAKAKKWEGWCIRVPGEESHVGYTLNGKAATMGVWKRVFVKEDDYIVTGAEKGKAGKHTGLYATFNLAQYLPDEETLHDCGNCGPGKLTHDRLKELTEEIDSGELKFPFVIQIEYRSKQEDSLKLSFPQFVEVRDRLCRPIPTCWSSWVIPVAS